MKFDQFPHESTNAVTATQGLTQIPLKPTTCGTQLPVLPVALRGIGQVTTPALVLDR
ncbi:MAG: hypothetical protein LBO75_01080 [Bifidobacteriaceae bacterium]|nr:hypothetical protein [Bifidobacteriaceae bacterium]